MALYHPVLYLHLLTVVVVVGGSIVVRVGLSQLRRARRIEQVTIWLRSLGILKVVFPVGVVLFFLTGGYMVAEGFSWREGWILVSAAALLVTHVLGTTASVATFKAIGMALRGRQEGPIPPEAAEPLRVVPGWYGVHVNLGLVAGIMWAMVTKPSGAMSAIVVASTAVLGLAVAHATQAPALPAAQPARESRSA